MQRLPIQPSNTQRFHYDMDSPVGVLSLVSDTKALIGLYFVEHRHAPPPHDRGDEVHDNDLANHPIFSSVRDQLTEYFAGQRQDFDVALDPQGTVFQHRVWAALRTIDFGETASYGQIASAIDSPLASRAVGAANGRNPISIIVPCHRVIGSNGSLTGYGGGATRKQALLDLERSVTGASLF